MVGNSNYERFCMKIRYSGAFWDLVRLILCQFNIIQGFYKPHWWKMIKCRKISLFWWEIQILRYFVWKHFHLALSGSSSCSSSPKLQVHCASNATCHISIKLNLIVLSLMCKAILLSCVFYNNLIALHFYLASSERG